MADFRKVLYAFVIVALLVGFTVPACAQGMTHVGLAPDGGLTFIKPDGTLVPMACDLLFPWVVGDATFTTSIVVANTSLDPCNGAPLTVPVGTCAAGFTAVPQSGKITFWYFGTTGISPASQTSSVRVPAGSYLAHIVSPSTVGTTTVNGLSKLPANFAGYVVAQAQFQYCQETASISANIPGFGTQTYIGLVLDKRSSMIQKE